jgi:hypothetical protein
MTKHDPNSAREATIRSPAPQRAAKATKTADIPDAVPKHA